MTHLPYPPSLARYMRYLHQHMTQVETIVPETVGAYVENSDNSAMAAASLSSLRLLEISLSRHFWEVP